MHIKYTDKLDNNN